MKLLLDTCVWGGARTHLQAIGHDVVWSGDWPEDPGDEQILAQAYAEDRVLVTLDKDFGEHAIVYRKPHCGIIRLVGISARQQAIFCANALERYGKDLLAGAIATVEPGRIRFRPPDDED